MTGKTTVRKLATVFSLFFGLILVGLTLSQQDNLDATLLQGLAGNEDFSTLVSLIDQAGLTDALSGAGPFTLFAPDNNVFEEVNPDILEQLNNDPELLKSVLQSHVVEGAYGILDLRNAQEGSVVTLNGDPLEIDVDAGGLKVNGADLVSTDVENTYSNGVLSQVGDLVLSDSLLSQLGLGEVEEATDHVVAGGVNFVDLDTNADGVLTSDELDTGIYTRYDANADGIVDQVEYDTNPGLFGGAFADYDLDGSGDLNQDEYRGAYEGSSVFDSLDTDGSGDINQEEYDTNPDLLGTGAAGAAVTAATATVVGAETGGTEVTQAEDAEMAAPATFTDLDADASGMLTEEEASGVFGANPDLFTQFDADGSGDISQEEYDANQDLLGLNEVDTTDQNSEIDESEPTLLQGLTENEDFSSLVALIDQAGLTADLEGAGPFTIFAPGNGVFEELNPDVLKQLNDDPELLKSVLQSHVVQGVYGIKDLRDAEEGSIMTLQGEPLVIDLGAGGLKVNGADLVSTDVDKSYSNGVLQEVGDLVLPASILSQLGLGETEEATDDAVTAVGADFADLDTNADGVLTADELDNSIYTRYDANQDGIIDQAEYDTNPGLFGGAFADFDADASGDLNEEEYRGAYDNAGLLNQLDTDGSGDVSQEEYDTNRDLLGLGAAGAAVTGAAATVVGAETGGADMGAETGGAVMFDGTVVDLLTNDGRFGTLLTAVTDAGLLDSLQQQAPYTLFAPTDDAFAASPDADRESILVDTDMLSNLLLYHVVPGKVMAEDLVGDEPGNTTTDAGEVRDGQATTLEGSDLLLTLEDDGSVTINTGQATVTEANLETSDGVVHVIDGVLIPESMMNQ
ncbi:hypothetical protein BH24DEI2_BH24DEI2_07480 [soil metagenome]